MRHSFEPLAPSHCPPPLAMRARFSEFDPVRAEVSKHERPGHRAACSPFDPLLAYGAPRKRLTPPLVPALRSPAAKQDETWRRGKPHSTPPLAERGWGRGKCFWGRIYKEMTPRCQEGSAVSLIMILLASGKRWTGVPRDVLLRNGAANLT
jgi:hypothetical protein